VESVTPVSHRILAIFAHPDDETFLAGGTLAKYADAGWEVSVLCATRGEAGRRGDYEKEDLSSGEFAMVRQREMEDACRVLGVREPLFLKCADQGIASVCRDSARAEIVRFLRKWKPDVVITFGPDGVSGHTDHVAIGGIATAAAREAGIRSLYYVLRSESLSTFCKPEVPVSSPPVTTVIDVSDFGERKLQAMRCYRSQKHLLSEDPAVIRDTVNGRERFYRALPAGFTVGREDHLFVPFA
jgi:LmbE family N-acetylglucosaminyl deacetylase